MNFIVTDRYGSLSSIVLSTVLLTWDDWNDFSFYTAFGLIYIDATNIRHNIGGVKIGRFGQAPSEKNFNIGDTFLNLDSQYFSLGQDDKYYENLNNLGDDVRDLILNSLNDIAKDLSLFEKCYSETVTTTSLLRDVNANSVEGQFHRMANGGARLTNYYFKYFPPKFSPVDSPQIELEFNVLPDSLPPTNIHVVIGRNGVGKTHLLNSMVNSLNSEISNKNLDGYFEFGRSGNGESKFTNVVFLSFSAFDDSKIHSNSLNKISKVNYSYVGLKKNYVGTNETTTKNPSDLKVEFMESLSFCIKNTSKLIRLKTALNSLNSDPNFLEANIVGLLYEDEIDIDEIGKTYDRLSSGHKIVLLSITKLVEKIEEKSIAIIDEPESHLHPPLLSAFIRSLSDLLINRNGIAIIATHSPVVIQEVPSRCVWKLRRSGAIAVAERLEIETFGENIGLLTQAVFGLEVSDSGFHNLLKSVAQNTRNYQNALMEFEEELGDEAKAILRNMIHNLHE
jgi:predicted ATPase